MTFSQTGAMDLNKQFPRIEPSRHSMVPRTTIPRSRFSTVHSYKTTFQSAYLIPFFLDEVLPADVFKGRVNIFARIATLLFPLMDRLTIETFFFFTPCRLLWENWVRMMGEQPSPSSSIDFTIPQMLSTNGGYPVGSIYDYFGLPTAGQLEALGAVAHSALPLRAYNLIWNEWFRDQNLQGSIDVPTDDGPDLVSQYQLKLRNKRHDYFTSALPWPLKGGVEVPLPMGGTAPVKGIAMLGTFDPENGSPGATWWETGGTNAGDWLGYYQVSAHNVRFEAEGPAQGALPMVYADLADSTGATINALRLATAVQRFLERDARGGTRYTEQLRQRFGVSPEDTRLQRPEYIGGGRMDVDTQAIPQTSETSTDSPLGALGAAATAVDRHSFSYTATEHGYIIGLVQLSANVTYWQGVKRLWTRETRYDFYDPAFANLGEQAILNGELYARGVAADQNVFGYQERWGELRHRQSQITGLFRPSATGSIEQWHLAQEFTGLPALNSSFIQDEPPLSRSLAAGTDADGMQCLFDSQFHIETTRAMPMFSVPGVGGNF